MMGGQLRQGGYSKNAVGRPPDTAS